MLRGFPNNKRTSDSLPCSGIKGDEKAPRASRRLNWGNRRGALGSSLKAVSWDGLQGGSKAIWKQSHSWEVASSASKKSAEDAGH